MIISLFIDNFANCSNKTFSFLDRENSSFAIHTDKIQTQSLISLEDNTLFLALSFLKALVTNEQKSLQTEEIQKYHAHINNIASFQLIFRIFGNNYIYNLQLSQKEIIQERFYQFDFFDTNNIGKLDQGKMIFQRIKDNILYGEKNMILPHDEVLISFYSDKKTAPIAYYQAYAYFKKELFLFMDTNFLSFMGKRGIATEGEQLLTKLSLNGATLIPFFSMQNNINKNSYYHVNCTDTTMQFIENNTLEMHGEITHYLENIQEFLATLHAMHSETYRIFGIDKINTYLTTITFFLLKEVFLLERDTKFNQLFFTIN